MFSSICCVIFSAAAIVAVIIILYRFDPATAGIYPHCPFQLMTGLQCPGCGTTRALHRLLHGDLVAAFRLNAMLFVAAPFAVLAAFRRRLSLNPAVVLVWLAAVLSWWVGRNLF